MAAATYIVKRHEIRATVNYPYTQAPIIVGSVNGFSAANPNNGNYYMDIMSISETSATVRTWVYEVVSAISGQQLSWVPSTPSNVRFDFTILSAMETDIYLQNEIVSTGTYTHNAMNKIEAGYDVTTAVPNGNYVVEGDANVTLHAGNSITLKPGTIISPGTNGSFHAYIDPFFTCTQYPMGMITNDNNYNGFPSVIKDYKVEREELFLATSDLRDISETSLTIYPNPSAGNVTIEYTIPKSDFVEITVHDNCGRPVYKLKNKTPHEIGTYQIKLSGVDLPSGVYYCVLETENTLQTQNLIITK